MKAQSSRVLRWGVLTKLRLDWLFHEQKIVASFRSSHLSQKPFDIRSDRRGIVKYPVVGFYLLLSSIPLSGILIVGLSVHSCAGLH